MREVRMFTCLVWFVFCGISECSAQIVSDQPNGSGDTSKLSNRVKVVQSRIKSALQLREISAFWGIDLKRPEYLTPAEFFNIVPRSDLLNQNFENFGSSDVTKFSPSTSLGVQLGFAVKRKAEDDKKFSAVFNVGFQHASGPRLYTNALTEISTPVDTIIAFQTGQFVPIDSVVAQTYSAEMVCKQLRLDLSVVISSNPQNRLAVFCGFGVLAAQSITNLTTVKLNQFTYFNPTIPQVYESITAQEQIEKFRPGAVQGGGCYVPLGFRLRISNEHPFWSKVNLKLEMRPTLLMNNIPGLGRYWQTQYINQFGISYAW